MKRKSSPGRIPQTKAIGDLGERAAARHLFFRGYRILERNWSYYNKEVDIIARRFGKLIFCEVKTRTVPPNAVGLLYAPADAVNARKRRNLSVAARAYRNLSGIFLPLRMDIIEVYLTIDESSGKRKILRLNHIKNAFSP